MTLPPDLPAALAACGGGLLLGTAFHLGLWWTVAHGLRGGRSALWFPVSGLLRLALAAGGFYWIGAGHWQRLLACLGGFVVAQMLVTVLAGPRTTPGVSHAS
jgi:F1F0 ATPase subunit 2